MLIKALPEREDILAMKSAQKRSFTRHPRKVDYFMANAALERAKQLKAAKSGKVTVGNAADLNKTFGKGKKAATSKKAATPRATKSDVPWQKIADAYNSGLNTKEIAEKFDLVRPKTKDGKENKFPYYLVVGYLTKLSHGVDVDGKHIEITRGAGGTRKEKK